MKITDKWYCEVPVEFRDAFNKEGFTKIPLEEAVKMIKEYKQVKELPETVEVKTSKILEIAGKCEHFKALAKELCPEIF